MFRLLRGPHRRGHGQAGVVYVPAVHRRGHGQAGVAYVLAAAGATSTRAWTGWRRSCSGYFAGYIDEDVGRQVSLMFRLLRGLHLPGHLQAAVAYVRATSGATSTRAWTGWRRSCSGYFGSYIDEDVGRQVSLMIRQLRGPHRPGPWAGRCRLCSGYFGCEIDEGMDRQVFLMFRLLRGNIGNGMEMCHRDVACHSGGQPQWRKLLGPQALKRPLGKHPLFRFTVFYVSQRRLSFVLSLSRVSRVRAHYIHALYISTFHSLLNAHAHAWHTHRCSQRMEHPPLLFESSGFELSFCSESLRILSHVVDHVNRALV